MLMDYIADILLNLAWRLFACLMLSFAVIFSEKPVMAAESCAVQVVPDEKVGYISAFYTYNQSTLIVSEDKGLFRLEGNGANLIASKQEAGTIFDVHSHDEDLIIGASRGFFRLEGDNLQRVAPNAGKQNIRGALELHPFGEALIVLSTDGLFRLQDNDLQFIDPYEKFDRFYKVQRYGDALLILSENGFFRLQGDSIQPIATDLKIDQHTRLYPHGEAVLLLSESGLYRLRMDNFQLIAAGERIGWISRVDRDGDGLLVNTDAGLFRLEGDDLRLLLSAKRRGAIQSFYRQGEALVVVADAGVYRVRRDDVELIAPKEESGSIDWLVPGGFYPHGEELFLITKKGLFRIDGRDLVSIAPRAKTGSFQKSYTYGEALFLLFDAGLFRLDGDDLQLIAPHDKIGRINKIYNFAEELLVAAEAGVFRVRDNKLQPVTSEEETGRIYNFYRHGEALLVVSANGVFRLQAGTLEPITRKFKPADLHIFHSVGEQLVLSTYAGVIRLHIDVAIKSAEAEPESATVSYHTNTKAPFRFEVSHPCVSTWNAEELSLLDTRTGEPIATVQNLDVTPSDDEIEHATIEGFISFEKRGTYNVRLGLRDNDGRYVPFGRPIEYRIAWTSQDQILEWTHRVWPILLVSHTLLFSGLIVGARWSDRCWHLVTDPIWGKLGLWFHFGLRHLGPLQRWIMARWFDRIRDSIVRRDYLPVPLTVVTGEVVRSDELLEHLAEKRCLWLQGNPGMGKTVLTEYLAVQYFANAKLPSLFAAYRYFGFVPIFIPLREFLAIQPNQAHPGRWVAELARIAVATHGVVFRDANLFRAVLRSGNFAVILDGANEVGRESEIELFAKEASSVRVLVTSQTEYAARTFETLRLPTTIGVMVRPLLRLFLGNARGDQAYNQLAGSPLLDAIWSGYDIRLVADLAEDDAGIHDLPDSRLALYDSILNAVRMADGSPYPVERLCEAAWRMWRDGERKFKGDEVYLSRDLLEPLKAEGKRIVRTLDGHTFEFRHDQMRGYLAARWAFTQEVAPLRLLETDSAIWRLGRSEQEVVWGFAAELVDQELGVQLWRWATRDPERAQLQKALQARGERENWPLDLSKKFVT